MADYDIYANITANTKGYEAGIKKAQESTKKFGTSVSKVIQGLGKSGLVGALGAVGLASAGVTATLGAVVKVVKKVAQSIGECTEAFRTQTKVETALSVSVQNNPLIDGTAIIRLKSFASEMQKASDIGDEQLLPMMSDLIAKGRTETETMQIIKVATDMASTGTISFENAVSQLNATLNGNIGRLGQQNAELKTLTEEELKSGKAVEILGQKYNGLAQATADSNKQLKNAIGDLKENLGAVFEKGLDPMRSYFAEVINNINQAISSSREFKQAMKDVFEESGEVDLTQTSDKLKTALDATINAFAEATVNYKQYLELYGKYIDEETDATAIAYRNDIAQLKEQATQLSNELLRRQKESQTQTQARLEAEARAKKEKEINDLKDEYLKKIATQEAKWEHIKEVTGEAVKNEEKIKFYQDSLVDLMTQAGGKITTNNQLFKDQVAIIERLQKTLNPEEKATSTEWTGKIREQAIARLEAEKEAYEKSVDLEKTTAVERYEIYKSFNDKIYELKKEQLEAEKEQALKSVENFANAEEEKNRIVYYYQNELYKLGQEYSTQFEQAGEEAGMSFGEGFAVALAVTKKVMSKVVDVVKKAINTISKIVNTIGNAFKNVFKWFENLFKFDPSKSLDDLLAFEDSVLTFFVETLPQLPYFFESALQSVFVLLQNISNYINSEQIKGVITGIIDAFVKYLPDILDMGMVILETLFDGATKALEQNSSKLVTLGEKIVSKIGELFDKIIVPMTKTLGNFVGKVIEALMPLAVEGFINALPDFIIAIVKGLVSSLKTIVKILVKALPDLVDAVLEVLTYLLDEVIPDLLPELITAIAKIVNLLVQKLPEIIRLVLTLVSKIIEGLPTILDTLLPSIIDSLLTVMPEIIVAVIKGITELITNLTTSDIWNLIASIGKMLLQIAVSLITFLPNFVKTILDGMGEAFESASWGKVRKAFKDTFQLIGWDFSESWNSAISKVLGAFKDMAKSITNALQAIWDFIQSILGGIKSVGEKAKDVLEDSKLVQGAKAVGEAVSSGAKTAGGWIADKATSAWNGLTSLFRHANGTNNAPMGLSLVGEAGPELVRFRGGEQVLNARNTQKALQGMGGNTNEFYVNFYNTKDTSAFALISQLKQYNRQMSINGVL